MKIQIVEEHTDEGANWLVSWGGSNPTPQECFVFGSPNSAAAVRQEIEILWVLSQFLGGQIVIDTYENADDTPVRSLSWEYEDGDKKFFACWDNATSPHFSAHWRLPVIVLGEGKKLAHIPVNPRTDGWLLRVLLEKMAASPDVLTLTASDYDAILSIYGEGEEQHSRYAADCILKSLVAAATAETMRRGVEDAGEG